METVLFDINEYYPPVEPEAYAHGEVRISQDSQSCQSLAENKPMKAKIA